MKKIYLLAAIFSALTSVSQINLHCGTDVVMRKLYQNNPALKLKKEQLDKSVALNGSRSSASTTYIIPIVFHVLHLNGPENISDAQVKDGLRILNRDFAKRNPDTTDIIPAFKNIADSAGIRFVLATKDPNGNCTNGIVHYYDTDTDWNDTSLTIFSHTWDPTRYLNVYLVRTITMSSGFGAAGYTYFPGTWLPGDSNDAIVVLNNYFASIGTGNSFLSRVLTHEVGHWLDLYHVFGGTNSAGVDCFGDDFVNDTPTTIGYLSCPDPSVPSQYQTCAPGVSENFQNYMDYSYCCRMFTQGQAIRMQAALQNNISGRDNLWTTSNLIATGIINPTVPCVPIADFKSNRTKVCVNTPVTFSDASWNGQPASYTWAFPGGTPPASTASAPVITYSTPGVYSVMHTVTNSAGTAAPATKTNYITVVSGLAAYTNSWTEGFESGVIPNNDWTLESWSGAVNWISSASAAYGGVVSAKLSKENNTRKTVTSMTGPMVNISGMPSPMLSFKVAAGDKSTHTNTLFVHASTDCGNTWNLVYNKSGTNLLTSVTSNPDFVPANKSEWRSELVSLGAYAGATQISFKFTFVRDTMSGANNVYLDNINIDNGTSLLENSAGEFLNYSVFPNPAGEEANVSFDLGSTQKATLRLVDVTGKTVLLTEEINGLPGSNTVVIRTAGIEKGIYILQLDVEGARFGKKLVIN